jgi:hypothetical protein
VINQRARDVSASASMLEHEQFPRQRHPMKRSRPDIMPALLHEILLIVLRVGLRLVTPGS